MRLWSALNAINFRVNRGIAALFEVRGGGGGAEGVCGGGGGGGRWDGVSLLF